MIDLIFSTGLEWTYPLGVTSTSGVKGVYRSMW